MKAPTLALPLLVVAVVSLSGCALGQGSGRTAEEAGDSFRQLLDDTQATIGGEWEVRDDPTARGCVIPLWAEGERFPALRISALPATASTALAVVEELWTDLGYTVEATEVGDATELQAKGEYQESLIFRVSDNGMTLQGESECRPD